MKIPCDYPWCDDPATCVVKCTGDHGETELEFFCEPHAKDFGLGLLKVVKLDPEYVDFSI